MRLKTFCFRVTKPPLEEIIAHPCEDIVKNKNPTSMIFLPTGEEVTILAFDSYKGTLNTSDVRRTCTDSSKRAAREGVELPDPSYIATSILLTKLDIKNRRRGYSLFLPDNKNKCDDYWRMGYGIDILPDIKQVSTGQSDKGYHLSEITMELGDIRIVPTQLLAR